MEGTAAVVEAVVRKLRWQVSNGVITTEDLYSKSIQALNEMALVLKAELDSTPETSFIPGQNVEVDSEKVLRLEVLKYFISRKYTESQAKKKEADKKVKKQQILELLQEAQNSELKKKTPEELLAMLAELG